MENIPIDENKKMIIIDKRILESMKKTILNLRLQVKQKEILK